MGNELPLPMIWIQNSMILAEAFNKTDTQFIKAL